MNELLIQRYVKLLNSIKRTILFAKLSSIFIVISLVCYLGASIFNFASKSAALGLIYFFIALAMIFLLYSIYSTIEKSKAQFKRCTDSLEELRLMNELKNTQE